MMKVDQLTSLQRRLGTARELTDVLLLESLELCCALSSNDVPEKYVLVNYCHEAAWEQAALWVITRCLPSWTLELTFNKRNSTAKLLSNHLPPFTIEVSHPRAAIAILIALTQAMLVLTKLGLNSQPR